MNGYLSRTLKNRIPFSSSLEIFALESPRSAARFSRHFRSAVTDGKVGKTRANQIIRNKTKAIAEQCRLKSEFSSSPPAVTLTRPRGDY